MGYEEPTEPFYNKQVCAIYFFLCKKAGNLNFFYNKVTITYTVCCGNIVCYYIVVTHVRGGEYVLWR